MNGDVTSGTTTGVYMNEMMTGDVPHGMTTANKRATHL